MQRYVIVSGSMTGTYDRGSVVFDQVVPVASLKVGDVITYRPPAGAGPDHLVTHRIAAITTRPVGRARVPHQGRRERGRRPVDVHASRGPKQARVRAGVPYVGYVHLRAVATAGCA